MPKIAGFDGKEVEYVEVHDEPFHRRQFSNDYVYIYIAGFRRVPGETSLWHRHSENTLYVCVGHGAAALNRPTDKEPFVHHASPGDLWWAMSKSAPYVHQVCLLPENTHNSHFFAMEILRPPPTCSRRALDHRCYSLREEDSRPGLARVYDFRLEPGESTGPHTLGFSGVVLCLSDGGGSLEADGGVFAGGELSKVGGWKWIDGPVSANARNAGGSVYQAFVVEWLGEGHSVEGLSRL
ncbi:unnamed protein product [Ectocarpus sp. CCAP 1310/34]|nr:unnamed protein product [Ectocarpus sp. CCAP 1310/34]